VAAEIAGLPRDRGGDQVGNVYGYLDVVVLTINPPT
jgi:hypothetical protein